MSTDLDRQKVHQKAFLAKAFGGASSYQGPGLERVHRGMGISDRQFDSVAGHLAVTLSELGVADSLIDSVIATVAGLKGQIVDYEESALSAD